ncbi:MAG: protein kinase domain-containing protein [Planctomycetota bacterium]
MSDSKPDPFVGRTFDGYRVDEVIGRGGMGTVYKAHQLSLGRPVAIKILPSDLAAQEQFLERFHREADALSRLSHPNVVTVFDRGDVDGQPYLAMEYVEGTSLRDIVRHGPLPADEALRIVSSVLAALEHAHVNGIVHRDIKPENVLLAQGGVVKVADFGLSRLLDPEDSTRLTRTQLVLGTYEYMAPEQRERSKEADPRSDLYATGVVLYEMLTGELPIGRFELPSCRRPDECDCRVDALIERSLDKDPEQRYQRAIEMADAVSAILERPEVQPAPPPPPGPQPIYKPIRFEYHIDNVATVDHVLGTIFYVLGFMSLFGVGFLTRAIYVSAPFFVFFIAGWYLRATADSLRKYKSTARTAQAVIAILASLTFLLIPFSIYSLWVLFSHRGRTYYEARSRGLSEQAAARHTYRMLEEPYAPPRPPPPPSAPPPPTAPRPSQIPVQSIVTSEVVDRRRHAQPRTSRWVSAGLWTLLGCALLAGLAGAVAPVLVLWLAVPALVGAGLLVVGFFHSLVTPGVRGALAAFVALIVFAVVAAVVALVGLTTRVAELRRGPMSITAPHPPISTTSSEYRVGKYTFPPPRNFEARFLTKQRIEWVRKVTGYPGKLKLVRRAEVVSLRMYGAAMSKRTWPGLKVCNVVQDLLERELPDRFRRDGVFRISDPEFARLLAENPPPD